MKMNAIHPVFVIVFALNFLLDPSMASSHNTTINGDRHHIHLLGESYLRHGVSGLTLKSNLLASFSGSIMYTTPVRFSSNRTNSSASSSYSIVNLGTFFISPENRNLGSPRGYLGLVDSSRITENTFWKDPNDNLVGLDMDSLNWMETADCMDAGIDLESGIDYNRSQKNLKLVLLLLTPEMDISCYLREEETQTQSYGIEYLNPQNVTDNTFDSRIKHYALYPLLIGLFLVCFLWFILGACKQGCNPLMENVVSKTHSDEDFDDEAIMDMNENLALLSKKRNSEFSSHDDLEVDCVEDKAAACVFIPVSKPSFTSCLIKQRDNNVIQSDDIIQSPRGNDEMTSDFKKDISESEADFDKGEDDSRAHNAAIHCEHLASENDLHGDIIQDEMIRESLHGPQPAEVDCLEGDFIPASKHPKPPIPFPSWLTNLGDSFDISPFECNDDGCECEDDLLTKKKKYLPLQQEQAICNDSDDISPLESDDVEENAGDGVSISASKHVKRPFELPSLLIPRFEYDDYDTCPSNLGDSSDISHVESNDDGSECQQESDSSMDCSSSTDDDDDPAEESAVAGVSNGYKCQQELRDKYVPSWASESVAAMILRLHFKSFTHHAEGDGVSIPGSKRPMRSFEYPSWLKDGWEYDDYDTSPSESQEYRNQQELLNHNNNKKKKKYLPSWAWKSAVALPLPESLHELQPAEVEENAAAAGVSIQHGESSFPSWLTNQGYGISPYESNDDGYICQDDLFTKNNKDLPSWARTSAVALPLPLQQELDPETVFAAGTFSHMDTISPAETICNSNEGAKTSSTQNSKSTTSGIKRPGKRDIKIAALKAAEAAKRVEQEKENERKMKKEALKVERDRIQKENAMKMKLKKKKNQEEMKKKEAEVAAMKRQKEEDERRRIDKKRRNGKEQKLEVPWKI